MSNRERGPPQSATPLWQFFKRLDDQQERREMPHNLKPFPEPPADVATLQEFYRGSRTEMFAGVLIALDGAIASEPDEGSEFARRCREELMPFVEAEREREEEGLTPLLEWERSLLP
jgi:hypothetical protein